MKNILIYGLLVMLVVVSGCVQKSVEQAADKVSDEPIVPATSVGPSVPGATGDSVNLDTSASEADVLAADLDSEDVDVQLDGINPDEVKDINF